MKITRNNSPFNVCKNPSRFSNHIGQTLAVALKSDAIPAAICGLGVTLEEACVSEEAAMQILGSLILEFVKEPKNLTVDEILTAKDDTIQERARRNELFASFLTTFTEACQSVPRTQKTVRASSSGILIGRTILRIIDLVNEGQEPAANSISSFKSESCPGFDFRKAVQVVIGRFEGLLDQVLATKE